mmetsp:Transcript_23658/g.35488  ORF Transcript_23658/g.35488 Transcript_23658/m.35488 type:complete len:205 (-) Transcript_23658:158-772(-)|eukprot:CAMPEP_0167757688 /NCGR_PEP_ID=MMETSP0110_2-20121227/10061_1 /TAXON_ID=629695 /ORGANISM="Gymnochlora sp., Strain CCMP2014" /LENGTH=204 /DNA_ID=CAMNT_0007643899 /DNA_START=207 /DNA_END=821 /DNA_ORIENTATION=-
MSVSSEDDIIKELLEDLVDVPGQPYDRELLDSITSNLEKLSSAGLAKLADSEVIGYDSPEQAFNKSILCLLCMGDSILAKLKALEAKEKCISKYMNAHGQAIPYGLPTYILKKGQEETSDWLLALQGVRVQLSHQDRLRRKKLIQEEKERLALIDRDSRMPDGIYSQIVKGFKSKEYKQAETKAVAVSTLKALFFGGITEFMGE